MRVICSYQAQMGGVASCSWALGDRYRTLRGPEAVHATRTLSGYEEDMPRRQRRKWDASWCLNAAPTLGCPPLWTLVSFTPRERSFTSSYVPKFHQAGEKLPFHHKDPGSIYLPNAWGEKLNPQILQPSTHVAEGWGEAGKDRKCDKQQMAHAGECNKTKAPVLSIKVSLAKHSLCKSAKRKERAQKAWFWAVRLSWWL